MPPPTTPMRICGCDQGKESRFLGFRKSSASRRPRMKRRVKHHFRTAVHCQSARRGGSSASLRSAFPVRSTETALIARTRSPIPVLWAAGEAERCGSEYEFSCQKTEIIVSLFLVNQITSDHVRRTETRSPIGRASAPPAESSARCRSGGERRILTCSCLVTALSRLRAIHSKVRRLSVGRSVRLWRSGGSMRPRTTPASRSRG